MPELVLACTLSRIYHVLFAYRSHEWSVIRDETVSSTRRMRLQNRSFPALHLEAEESTSMVEWQLDSDSIDDIILHLDVVQVLHHELSGDTPIDSTA